MEAALNLAPSGHELEPHTQQAMEWLYQVAIGSNDDLLWYTSWQIVLKDERMAIGSMGFAGPPGANGSVEFGYSINESFRCNGYMTEPPALLLPGHLIAGG